MIEYNFQDFIYYNDDALHPDMCKELVDFFGKNKELIEGYRVHQIPYGAILPPEPTIRDDYVWFLNIEYNKPEHLEAVENAVRHAIEAYQAKYRFLWRGDGISWPAYKYHIVKKSGGYHEWHHEWNIDGSRDRVVVWHLALTDHEEEGELEFLHFGHRIAPKAGRIVLWPAGFTHVHRGNAIRTDTEKHYLTGWYYCH